MEQLIVEETEDIRSGYTIIFQFKTNPFFENTEVSVQFLLFYENPRVSHSNF